MQSLAGIIGMTPTQVYRMNDMGLILDKSLKETGVVGSGMDNGEAGREYLFNRMKEALARAKENAGE
jgi:hypothetical protein